MSICVVRVLYPVKAFRRKNHTPLTVFSFDNIAFASRLAITLPRFNPPETWACFALEIVDVY